MKKIGNLLLGLSASVATLVPCSIALTSCNKALISYIGTKYRTVPKTEEGTSKYSSIIFTLADANKKPKETTIEFLDTTEEETWLYFAGGQPGVGNQYTLFFYKKAGWTGDFPRVTINIHFDFEVEGQTEYQRVSFVEFKFDIEK